MPEYQLYLGDCVQVMYRLDDCSVDLTVTSPPYDNLRKYEGFVFDLEKTIRQLYRITKDGGVVVWVTADKVKNRSETGSSFRHALCFMEDGFNLHDTMIYETPKMPVNDSRYQPCFEYMFVFSKGKVKTFNPIKDKRNTQAGVSRTSSTQRNPDGSMKKMNKTKPTPEFGIRNNIWRIESGYMKTTVDKYAYAHPAMFPEVLARDHILSWSNPNDVVLDPMMGSGTTGKMAILNNRNFIGIDVSDKYFEIAKRRVCEALKEVEYA